MSRSSAAERVAPTFESLAEQLRDGPLKCLTALQDHAEALAEEQPAGHHELLAHLQNLVTLAQFSMTRFREFTAELKTLVDHVARESAAKSTNGH